jgi:hypothetical protein
MGTAATLLRPDYPFQAYIYEEARLRINYLRIDLPETDFKLIKPNDLLVRSAVFLELFLVGACLHEALLDHQLTPHVANRQALRRALRAVQEISGLDAIQVFREAQRHFHPELPDVPPGRLQMEAVVRAMKSLLAACPIDALEHLASELGLEVEGHRCRVAYDGIQAFVLRSDPQEQQRIRILGRQYANGSITLQQISQLLSLHPVDAIALLESRGFSRPIDVVRLSDADRQLQLDALRKARFAHRDTRAPISVERVARDVIASERIESVDARRWIPRPIQ